MCCENLVQVRKKHQSIDEGVFHKIERVRRQGTDTIVSEVRTKRYRDYERETGREYKSCSLLLASLIISSCSICRASTATTMQSNASKIKSQTCTWRLQTFKKSLIKWEINILQVNEADMLEHSRKVCKKCERWPVLKCQMCKFTLCLYTYTQKTTTTSEYYKWAASTGKQTAHKTKQVDYRH